MTNLFFVLGCIAILLVDFLVNQSDTIKKLLEVIKQKHDTRKLRVDSLFDGMTCLLKSEIYSIYQKGESRGYLSPTEFDIASSAYTNYRNLGGNHTMPAIYDRIKDMEIKEIGE